jgi:hypothetical protein
VPFSFMELPCYRTTQARYFLKICHHCASQEKQKWSHDDQGFNPRSTVDYIAETLALLHGLREKKLKQTKPTSTWKRPPM